MRGTKITATYHRLSTRRHDSIAKIPLPNWSSAWSSWDMRKFINHVLVRTMRQADIHVGWRLAERVQRVALGVSTTGSTHLQGCWVFPCSSTDSDCLVLGFSDPGTISNPHGDIRQ